MSQYIYKKINGFNQVDIPAKSLVVLDIDETTLKYCDMEHGWWQKKFRHYYSIHDCYNKAEELCLEHWKETIGSTLPTHTDKDGFFNLLNLCKEKDCEVIMVTARNDSLKGITHEHLTHLDIFDIEVYFASGRDKGLVIKDIIDEVNIEHDIEHHKPYDKIIFIDDLEQNLRDVKNVFGDEVECYKFVCG